MKNINKKCTQSVKILSNQRFKANMTINKEKEVKKLVSILRDHSLFSIP